MASNHDPLIVNTVAYAIDLSSQTKSELGEMKFKASAIAAIDTLIGLGWRPPLTEQERIVLNHAAIMLSMEDTLPARYDEGVIRALLAGGRHG